jgi:hypothetical protein
MTADHLLPGSFRDPSGFLFRRGGELYRQVNLSYRPHYDRLIASGLYDDLASAGLLIHHEEARTEPAAPDLFYKVIKPEPVSFISYPFEWCFGQLKDAALLTLRIQKAAFEKGMFLKDASAYNVQFHRGRPVFIDTLSFETYSEGTPWVAYRQFCQHFLAPLALMSRTDVRLGQLSRTHLDGVPLDLAAALLPGRTKLEAGLLTHIHLHSRSQQKNAGKPTQGAGAKMSRLSYLGLIDHLEGTVSKLTWEPQGTVWADYYDETNYSEAAFARKKEIVARLLDKIGPRSVWDLGANTGEFSRLASGRGIETVAFDMDPAAVEKCYREVRSRKEQNLLPLLMDLTNPTPPYGWASTERMSLVERGPADMALALALVHHLAIGNNVPFGRMAEFFAAVCKSLIVEFVPKTDSQVQRMLATREDVFTEYNAESFERAFSGFFRIEECTGVQGSDRTIYLMRRLSDGPGVAGVV